MKGTKQQREKRGKQLKKKRNTYVFTHPTFVACLLCVRNYQQLGIQEHARLSPALKKFTIQLAEGLSCLSSWFLKDEKSRYVYR